MKCEKCGKQLRCGAMLTPNGNEVEYMECSCGYFEVEAQKSEGGEG